MKLYPFHSKELPDIQKKLFRRARGMTAVIAANGNTTLEFTIPYAWCKITTIEIIGLPCMMQSDLFVLDSIYGTYSTVPKYQLNQFGFDVNISPNYYRDHSEYDADLYMGMIIKVVIKNTTNQTPTVGLNLTLHEVA